MVTPRRKETIREKKRARNSERTAPQESVLSRSSSIFSGPPRASSLLSFKNIILIGFLLFIAVIWKFKGYFIVAIVNGQPISRFELTNQLVRRFGQQTLDNIINERLILSAARQKGVFIKAEEINARVKQIEEKLTGTISLADAIKMQGLTTEEFRRQIEIQLSIDKLFDKEATVSPSQIDEYFNSNRQAYKNATDPAAIREEIKAILRQQKITDLFDSWFSDIRKNAKIVKFLQ